MPYEFKLPDVAEGTEEGEIVTWLVEVGQDVEEDQKLAEIQTDKVQTELYSPVAGKVSELLANEGDIVPVGSVLVRFLLAEEESDTDVTSSESGEGVRAQSETTALEASSGNDNRTSATTVGASSVSSNGAENGDRGTGERKKSRATPAVRRVARELGVDIELVEGSGSGGRIMDEDVRSYALALGGEDLTVAEELSYPAPDAEQEEASAVAPGSSSGTEQSRDGSGDSERVPIRGIQRAMFRSMTKSSSTVAHSFGLEEVDVSELVALRGQMGQIAQDKEVRLTYLPFVVKAVATALKEFEYLNASVDEDQQQIVLHKRYDIGVAVDTPQGLVVPVLRRADERSIFDVARGIVELAQRGRSGDLGMEDFEGATFTVTNVGAIGGIAAMPIVDYPQIAILGLHRIQRKPVVKGESEIVASEVMNMSLSFDHRVIDGAMCFNFLARLKELLEIPNLLFMEMS